MGEAVTRIDETTVFARVDHNTQRTEQVIRIADTAEALRRNLNPDGLPSAFSQQIKEVARQHPDLARAPKPARFHSTLLSVETMHEAGDLLPRVLRARHRAFIERQKWDLPEVRGMEFDQYDTPAAYTIAVHESDRAGGNGDVLGGLRLMPTTARCGIYTYMLKDAQDGLLKPGLPDNLLYDKAPVDPKIWEVTRGFVSDIVPARDRARVQMTMATRMMGVAKAHGVSLLLALLPANWHRWSSRRNLPMRDAGPVLNIGGIDYQAVQIEVP